MEAHILAKRAEIKKCKKKKIESVKFITFLLSVFSVQCSMCDVRVSDVPPFFIQTWHCGYLFYFCSQTHFSPFFQSSVFFSLHIFHFLSISCTHKTTQKLNWQRPRHAFAFMFYVFVIVGVVWLMAACGCVIIIPYTIFSKTLS